jgi:hypothetical protein
MSVIPAMHKSQFRLIAEVIAKLPPECRNIVAWRFASALMGTNRDFNTLKFIKGCGCDTGPAEKETPR